MQQMCCNMFRLHWDENGQVSFSLAGPHLRLLNTWTSFIMYALDWTQQKFDVWIGVCLLWANFERASSNMGRGLPSSQASIFRLGHSFRVTWYLPRKSIDREGLGESRTGTRHGRLISKQNPVNGYFIVISEVICNLDLVCSTSFKDSLISALNKTKKSNDGVFEIVVS